MTTNLSPFAWDGPGSKTESPMPGERPRMVIQLGKMVSTGASKDYEKAGSCGQPQDAGWGQGCCKGWNGPRHLGFGSGRLGRRLKDLKVLLTWLPGA